MDKKYIIMAIVVLVIIYFIVNQLLVDKAVASSDNMFKSVDANSELSGLKGKIRKGVLSDFAYSFWIYVEGWDSTKKKSIVEHGVSGSCTKKRKIYLGESTNELFVNIPIKGDRGCSTQAPPISVPNIPLQRWVHVVVTTHNRTLDLYLNGKLVRSRLLDNIPVENNKGDESDENGITICKSSETYEGKFSRFSYHEKALNPRDVREIYAKGPEPTGLLGGLLGKYKIKLLFMKGSDTISSASI